jgi:hypothetical protein
MQLRPATASDRKCRFAQGTLSRESPSVDVHTRHLAIRHRDVRQMFSLLILQARVSDRPTLIQVGMGAARS